MRWLMIVACTLACACAPGSEGEPVVPDDPSSAGSTATGDTDLGSDTDDSDTDLSSTDTDATTTDTASTSTPAECPGDFPSGEGPGCCTMPNALTPDAGRAVCNAAGSWTCAQGQLCTCQGVVAGFECLDDCAWTLAEPPGCIFSDHYECFAPTEVDARTCP